MAFDPAAFREIISGERRGLRAALGRAALAAAEPAYAAAVRLRNLAFDRGWRRSERAPVPVVSVGNLTVGGTGKTPLVIWLARWLRRRGVRVALVSRGYGAGPAGRNDEALELEQRLPDVPHLQDPRRARAARLAAEELAAQLLLLDDAFQHRQLRRDLDLVLLDATAPWGYGRLLPRGLLREPCSALRRAQAVILTRADLVSPEQRAETQALAARLAPGAAWAEAAHRPQALIAADGGEAPLALLAGTRVAAFCGLGNPEAFRRTLLGLGCEIAAWRRFPDHHRYTREDVAALHDWVRAARGAAVVVCSHKDLVKLDLRELGDRSLWALQVEIELLRGQAELETLLAPLVEAALRIE